MDAFGCDNKALLAAAADKHACVIEVPDAQDDGLMNHESIATIMTGDQEGIYHGSGSGEEDGIAEEHIYINLGRMTPMSLTRFYMMLSSMQNKKGYLLQAWKD